jgi:hypothetical protein
MPPRKGVGLNRRSGDGEAPKIRVTGSCATQSSKPSSQQAQDFLEARRAVANAKLAEFRKQCWRLSSLVRQGRAEKIPAIDLLWEIAICHALVRALGPERVQIIISEAFLDADLALHGEGRLMLTNAELTNAELDANLVELDRQRSFLLFRDLKAQSSKEWLVHNFLGHGEASAMYGKPGDGKSVLAEDLALHVSAGWDWHGRRVRKGAVLYVALERYQLIQRRAIAFREKYGVPDLPFAMIGGVFDFRNKRTTDDITARVYQIAECTDEPVVLICIDTLSRALCGGDENAPKDMGAIVTATGLLQQGTGAHVMWVHHMPIDGSDRMRGHGALLGAMDTTIHVVKGHDLVRTATVVKANDSEEGQRIGFNLESILIGTDAEGNQTTAPVVVPIEVTTARAQKPSRSLPKSAQIALRALAEALDEQGERAPASNHIPNGVKVIKREAWRPSAAALLGSTSPQAEIPFVVEAWVEKTDEKGDIEVSVSVNRTPVTGEIDAYRNADKDIVLFGCGLRNYFEGAPKKGEFNIDLNILTPYCPITSDGKAPDLKPFISKIGDALVAAAKKAQRAAPKERHVSQKDIVLENLDAVIAKVSDNGKYRFNSRQLLYRLRPIIKDELDKELTEGNFNAIITDYEVEHGEIPGMYREPRGSIYHPHLHETIPLGTLTVEDYERPIWNFNKVVYIEKEGFSEALKDNGWPERHDCMVMSSKGNTTRAAKDLIDKLAKHDEPCTIYCVHDADAYGTMIYQTFQEATRARGARKIQIINLGLEPWEAVEMSLEVEDVEKGDRRKPAANYVLEREDGDYWEEWLQTHRVELNAMTTPEFIEWLDAKMAEHGDGKLIPPPDVLTTELDEQLEHEVRDILTERILQQAGLENQVTEAMASIKRPNGTALAKNIGRMFEHSPKTRMAIIHRGHRRQAHKEGLKANTVANKRTPLKGCVRVRSPNTAEQCSPMFAVR